MLSKIRIASALLLILSLPAQAQSPELVQLQTLVGQVNYVRPNLDPVIIASLNDDATPQVLTSLRDRYGVRPAAGQTIDPVLLGYLLFFFELADVGFDTPVYLHQEHRDRLHYLQPTLQADGPEQGLHLSFSRNAVESLFLFQLKQKLTEDPAQGGPFSPEATGSINIKHDTTLFF